MSMTSNELTAASCIDLAWSLWRELGVPGVVRRHSDVVVVPEPLILFTGALGSRDPRLRDEAIAWCIDHVDLLSANQLNHVFSSGRWGVATIADVAATLGEHTRVRWPGATIGRPFAVPRRRGRSGGRFSSPSQLALRLRALFGVGARPEILRVLLSDLGRDFTIADLGALANMTKRNASDAVTSLEAAGVLAVNRLTTTHRVRLLRTDDLVNLVAPLPHHHPDWAVLLRLAWGALEIVERTSQQSEEVQEAELRRLLRALPDLLARVPELGLHPPPGARVGPVLARWVEALATPTGLEVDRARA